LIPETLLQVLKYVDNWVFEILLQVLEYIVDWGLLHVFMAVAVLKAYERTLSPVITDQ